MRANVLYEVQLGTHSQRANFATALAHVASDARNLRKLC
jgi:hypothetical protein